MTDVAATDEPIEAATAPKPAKVWHDRIKDAEEAFAKWREQCANIDKLYARERADSADREYAIFWANIEVLRPATYARPPVPVVAPRFKDGNALAREGSETLERALVVSFEQSDIDGVLREVRDDFLRHGRGTAWVRLGGQDDRIEYDFVAGSDFLHGTARNWREVPWVAKRAWLTRDEGVARFGDAFKAVPLKKRDENAAVPDKGDKAPVWEIWDKAGVCVHWVSTDYPETLDYKPAAEVLSSLSGFWPCPKPAYGTLKPGSLVPVPEILQYKDQIEEINEYTARIAAISESLRMVGFYPAGAGDLSEAIETAVKRADNRAMLLPISSFAALGGSSFKDSIVWMPVAEALQLVQGLVELRRVVIEDVYQITGISDIVRGATDPRETKGAQQLKSQWGSLRIRERQNELARFARDLTRISAEIMAENFPPDALFEMAQSQLPSADDKAQAQGQMQQMQVAAQQQAAMAQAQGAPPTPPPQLPKELTKLLDRPSREEVAEFLANDRARGFVIEIETDSTIQPDEDAEKQRRMEFGQAIGALFQHVAPLVMQAPMLGQFAGEVMKFMAGGFRASRPLEGAIDQFVEMLEGMAAQAAGPQQPPPDPLAQAKAEAEKRRVALDERRYQEIERPTAAVDLALKQREAARDERAQMTEEAHAAHQARLAERTQGHAEAAAARDSGLALRQQAHAETAHRDTLDEEREARAAMLAARTAAGA